MPPNPFLNDKEVLSIITKILSISNGSILNCGPDKCFTLLKAACESKKNDSILKITKAILRLLQNTDKKVIEFEEQIKTKDPYKCFVLLMSEISRDKKYWPGGTPKTTSAPSIMSFTDTPLSSTKICDTNLTTSSINVIRDKVVQAAIGGLSKSAQRSSLQGNNLAPASSPSSPFVHTKQLWDFNLTGLPPYQQTNAVAIPITEQEMLVLNELIYCLVGIAGNYITPSSPIKYDPITFTISDQIQKSLCDIALQILPLASHYSQIQRFIQYASGINSSPVLQAASGALRTLLKDYYESICQLESELLKGNLTLHKLLYHIRPTMSTMKVLADTIVYIAKKDIKGGRVLTVLHDKISSLTGDSPSQKLLIHLTQMAAVPYMEIMQLWILKGVIVDPQMEFFVVDNERIEREEMPEQHYSADYWEKRYVINREKVPRFLEKLSDVILRTGKYLNVIRQCGKNVVPPISTSIIFSHTDQHYVTFINSAYSFASRTLLELLMKENDLMGHLQSVKRYFLLQQGDFIEQFMDTCEQELAKNVDDVLPIRLENLLQVTLRISSAQHDPYNDDLKTELLPYDLITQISKIIKNEEEEYWTVHDKLDLSGLECFAFTYDVKWPISLVLNHSAISKYQMLFRQLFYCKHVERQLNRVWISTNHAKKFSSKTSELYRSAFTLRQRMMNAIQNLEYYMMIEVIEPNWHAFIEKMSRVENVDDVLTVHQDFHHLCLHNCMVTDSSLLRCIVKLCSISLRFCDFMQKAQRHFLDAELTSMLCSNENSDQSDSENDYSSQMQSESSLAPSETFSERVKRFDLEFTGVLNELLKRVNDISSLNPSDKFINLVHRINFNSYYSDQMKALSINDVAINHNF